MGCTESTMIPMKDRSNAVCIECCNKRGMNLSIDMNVIHSSHSPYLGSFFFASPSPQTNGHRNDAKTELDVRTSSTVSSEDDQMFFPEPLSSKQGRSRVIENASNTLPSFRRGCPLHLKIMESYRKDNNEDKEFMLDDNFSYDPDLTSGEYIIKTKAGAPYGGGLRVKMGAQFSWLGDQRGRIIAGTWSRQSSKPSHIIYSVKPFFPGQQHSTQRSVSPPSDCDDPNFKLYPWAFLKKDGPNLKDSVSLYLVDEEASKKKVRSNNGLQSTERRNSTCGSIFSSQPFYRSKNTFQDGVHAQTIVSRINPCTPSNLSDSLQKKSTKRQTNPIPCAFVNRNPLIFDVFDAIIAPGIDPLLMICCLTAHTRMDLEIMLSHSRVQSREYLI